MKDRILMIKRLEITLKPHLFDAEGAELRQKIQTYFNWRVDRAQVVNILTFDTDLTEAELGAVQNEIFTNPVTQHSSFDTLATYFDWAIWIGFRPGVRDTAGSVACDAISDYLGRRLESKEAVYTSKLYLLHEHSLEREQIESIAKELLANEIIQQWQVFSRSEWDSKNGIGFKVPKVILSHAPTVVEMPIPSDEELMRLSVERNLALNPRDIPIIRQYFLRSDVIESRRRVGLSVPTDVELETISQARSDHCNHNTFGGKFFYKDLQSGESIVVDNLFKSCIQAPTLAIQKEKDWVVSVLWDNAGIARFDDRYNYAITGETHNSPSNMEAYGGSITGIVGIYRDIMGVGKGGRLIAGLYGFCVGPRDYPGPLKPHLHPRRLLDGIVEGVRDGGNKHGVPTPLGSLFHHASYLGKCLVFVASLGIMENTIENEPVDQKTTLPNDVIIMSGGRVGKDGIHGVTASSESYSEHTPAGHVQIGDPYTQKKMHDFLLEARDECLVAFITDNGGGGLSSSIGESARFSGGAVVDLEKVPLKYEGLDVWEIWVSESQERMTVAVHDSNVARFMELSRKHNVESTVIGRYEGDGKLHLKHNGKTCAYLDLSFFTEDFPQWTFDAEWVPPDLRNLHEPVLGDVQDMTKLLKEILASPNVCSREWIQRQYDHEVQGTSVIKYFVGLDRDVPGDAVVLRPVLESSKGLAIAQALNPTYSLIDTYDMVAITIDEAIRRLVSVGGNLYEIGGVDNFCWPSIQYDPITNPDGRYKAAQLVRANWALRDACVQHGIPLLSGKDSMYIDGHLKGEFGERHKVSGLPTMQFTATTIVPDIMDCITMDPKEIGDLVYVLGLTYNELGGSEYYEFLGYTGLNVPKASHNVNRSLYRAVSSAIRSGVLSSCHGVYRGGIGVHAILMSFGTKLGMNIDLRKVPVDGKLRDDQVLFSESAGRFLVTVKPESRDVFESMFQGLPCAAVGKITDTPRMMIQGQRGGILVDELVSSLKSCWRVSE
jgi:phosphoribosylformylglycinamidine synthase subunit PurSL